MENPLCLSFYFVNKQNLRSFGNIIKWNIFKEDNKDCFYKLLVEEDFLVSNLTTPLKTILTSIKENLKSKSKHDFKNYFPKDGNLFLHPVDKESLFNSCWKALNEIIPKKFFGNNQNSKIFKSLIKIAIYSMKRQHFYLEKIFLKWNFSVLPWNNLSEASSKKILYNIVKWVVKYLLSSIIGINFYVTTCKLDANENKLYYFWKDHWQSFYDKQISKMVFTKIIQKYRPYSLGKKSKRNHSLIDRKKLKILGKDIPKLYLTLKPNSDCRPIVCYKNDIQNSSEKYKIKERLKFLRLLNGKPMDRIEIQYNNMYAKWLKANKPKLYFIKTDLSNAFGSINRDKLLKILSERYINYQRTEKCVYMKKKMAQQFRDIITELRKPLLIRAGSTVYEWKEGLVQGYKYSPALSELYYSYMDKLYFCEHMKFTENQVKLFIRVVDDYMYVTDLLEDALSFLNALSNYRNVNYEKTVVNFQHESIKYSEEIFFLGYCYNTSNLQVSRASNIYSGQMCYKIAFSSGISNLYKFIESRVGQSGIQINSHIFNLNYNNEEIIWRHIFSTFCLSANKFCTILAILCSEQEMMNFLQLYKKRVSVKLSNSMIDMLIRNKPKDSYFIYCINHFRYLSWQALHLCAKFTPKCTGLVPSINNYLAKSNCVFGKWREHARRIDINGECLRPAVREICRRTDLRKIFKDFNELPKGFECYHHKKLM
ncbi:telomerase reverse transcriptase-like [Trichoplusia ni]|uniref:Telomerase reverse transcriptase n=1 Tax=Trichoplusia ni TaxID=7111 RepID=A0A7E5VNM5_TRINI|nr:telomerase reverse transcriptase-like [Trichoplusia ni]